MASLGLEHLTDSQIRAKLLEFGENIGPVTSTTRKLYLKKLKSLIDGNILSADLNSSRSDPHNNFPSSEEENDGTSKPRRRSLTPTRINKSPGTRRKSPSRATLGNDALANSTFIEPKIASVKDTFVSPSLINDYETRRATRSSLGLNNSVRSQGIYGDDESELDVSNTGLLLSQSNKENFKVTNNSPSKLTSPDLGTGLSDTFKSRLQASGSTSYTSTYNSPRLTSSNQPFASDFVRKLSANRSSVGASFNTPLDVKESDDEDTGSPQVYSRFNQGGRTSSVIQGRGKQATSRDSWLPFDSPISTILLFVFSLFFVVIGVTYVNMHTSDTTVSSPGDIHYPLCSTVIEGTAVPRVNCIRDVDKDITTKLFKIIYSELYERLKSSPCSAIGDGPFGLADVDIQSAVLLKDPTMGTWITQQQLPNVKILISSNPHLNLVDITGGIAIVNPPLPFYCLIVNNIALAATWFLKIFLVVAIFFGVYYLVHYCMKRQALHKEEVYKLANSIIEIVASRSLGPDGYVPIIHVRDQLISPKDRQRMEKLWNDAVEVLNNDSRIRCEQQFVEGEDCLVWRWVASSPYNSNKRKTWQGQAFDTMEGSVNSLPNSPTSCLKIRHMFDAATEEGDDWVSTVVDAILWKTRDARILHIAVEKQSREGCVYMKCASPTDAGKAYRALHGSWFDSKLVTVKYIREARYLERFPESAKCTEPLYPSNTSHKFK